MHGVKRIQWTKELLKQKRENERQEIKVYRALNDEVLDLKDRHIYTEGGLLKTTQLLNMNPEFNAVWNYRRLIIMELSPTLNQEFWDGELLFTMAKLKVRPKVYWIWTHRVWCLENYPQSSLKLWLTELAIVSKLLDMDSRNFHGWHYRRYIVRKVEEKKQSDINLEEFEYTTKKINQDISNFSAWFQRTILIEKMIANNQVPEVESFLDNEFGYIKNAIFTDPEDQSVWTYLIWFIKKSAVSKLITADRHAEMLTELTESIIMINEDEICFSGKDNIWCLKTLIEIEGLQKKTSPQSFTPKSRDYLEKLIVIDPMRKNRYLYQLQTL